MRRTGMRLLAVAFAMLLVGAMAGQQSVRAADFSVTGAVIICSELPEFGPYYASPLCDPADGIGIKFENENGELVIGCSTSSGGCSIDRPFGSTTVVTLDESDIPADYYLYSDNPQTFVAPDGPPDGVVGFPLFVLLPTDAAPNPPVNNVEQGSSNINEGGGLLVVVYEGDCGNLGPSVANLNIVEPELGEAVGDPNALTAAMSVTIGAPFFLDEAIDGWYALVVYSDTTFDQPSACGELGGVNNHDGLLPIALAPIGANGLIGVATFSYNAGDETTTDVTVIVSELP